MKATKIEDFFQTLPTELLDITLDTHHRDIPHKITLDTPHKVTLHLDTPHKVTLHLDTPHMVTLHLDIPRKDTLQLDTQAVHLLHIMDMEVPEQCWLGELLLPPQPMVPIISPMEVMDPMGTGSLWVMVESSSTMEANLNMGSLASMGNMESMECLGCTASMVASSGNGSNLGSCANLFRLAVA